MIYAAVLRGILATMDLAVTRALGGTHRLRPHCRC
jgi:hypothetical protein